MLVRSEGELSFFFAAKYMLQENYVWVALKTQTDQHGLLYIMISVNVISGFAFYTKHGIAF